MDHHLRSALVYPAILMLLVLVALLPDLQVV